MASVAARPVTLDEFLLAEESSEEKLELHAGEIITMPRGSIQHAEVISKLHVALGRRLSPPCKLYGDAAQVYVAEVGSSFHPDLMVACPPNVINGRSGVIDNPQLVVEVLSPGTAAYDLGEKFRSYELLPSLEEIVFVEARSVYVEVHRRNSDGFWVRRTYRKLDESLDLLGGAVSLPVNEVYDGVAFDVE